MTRDKINGMLIAYAGELVDNLPCPERFMQELQHKAWEFYTTAIGSPEGAKAQYLMRIFAAGIVASLCAVHTCAKEMGDELRDGMEADA